MVETLTTSMVVVSGKLTERFLEGGHRSLFNLMNNLAAGRTTCMVVRHKWRQPPSPRGEEVDSPLRLSGGMWEWGEGTLKS